MEDLVTIKTKGLGFFGKDLTSEKEIKLSERNFNLLKEEISLPAAVLNKKIVDSNLSWMKTFLEFYNFELAPHGKTTMAPEIFKLQTTVGGAWGLSFATAPQVQVAHSFGVEKVLFVNQLVGKVNMEIISDILLRDPKFYFACIVDSVKNVNQLGEFFKSRNQSLNLLLEFGVNGGRTGIRNETGRKSVVSAISSWKGTLSLVGLEFFEGVIKTEAGVRELIQTVVTAAKDIQKENQFSKNPVIISGAGSAWFDIVAEELFQARKSLEENSGMNVQIILRPGCYLTHDRGLYTEIQKRIQTRNPVKCLEGKSLLPALQVWAYVHSIPESHLAIVGLGRRDVSFDCGFPIPSLHFRQGWQNPVNVSAQWKVTNMMDQHVFLNFSQENEGEEKIQEQALHNQSQQQQSENPQPGNKVITASHPGFFSKRGDSEETLQVGDIVIFDIIHPCTTFDKWRNVLMVDEQFNVVNIMSTYF